MRIRGTSGEVFVELWGPLLFVTWFGDQDVPLVDRFFDEFERLVIEARAASELLILVTDALDAKAPGAVVRRRIMERTNGMPPYYREVQVANYVVLANAMVRGALTAMSWLSRGPWDTEYVATPADAIQRAREVLRARGYGTPDELDPASYRRPSRA
ncbi:MAG: hypothetical protein KC619_23160 [Myxococcales bacterium]|nr:hypothetical protein [Myxococcales bacterium]